MTGSSRSCSSSGTATRSTRACPSTTSSARPATTGTEIVNVSPDVNASHTHADYQVVLEGATDAAFGLSLVQVMFAEDIAHWDFLREQTDMPLLVRTDNRRFLRQTDVEGAGREDQLYVWDMDRGLVAADRTNLKGNGTAWRSKGRTRSRCTMAGR